MIIILVLILINIYIISIVKENKIFTEVKIKYYKLIQAVKDGKLPEKYRVLEKPVPLTGYENMYGYIGYNTNKGSNIGLCLDGEPNDIFHVLLHELAHSTVDEYDHSKNFWNNFRELKNICEKLGIYEKIKERKKFCKKHIQDM